MDNKKNLLVTLADSRYIEQAKQLFSSVYWNAGWSGDYMLLAHEIPDEELKWFSEKRILIKKCKTLFNGQMGDCNYSTSVLGKFFLFTEEFKKWEHVIFLDADIIVKASLDKLNKTKAFSSPLTCKKDFRSYFSNSESEELSRLQEEYDLKRPAFNSGFMAFNTSIIKDDTFDKIIDVFNKYATICNSDDSILNLFFYNQWIKIPLVYNAMTFMFGLKKHKAIVLHFNNPVKLYQKNLRPWDKENPFYEEWKANLDRAEFIDLNSIQKAKKWNIFKIYYNSLVLKVVFSKYKTYNKLKFSPFRYKLESFFRYTLKSFFIYIIKTPDRILGQLGMWIKKSNAGLYNKLKKIKGRK
jgi:lipopolysaccharide biosynthesis glycosyltransferase